MWDSKKQCIHQSPGTCQGQDSHCTLPAGNTVCHIIRHIHPAGKWYWAETVMLMPTRFCCSGQPELLSPYTRQVLPAYMIYGGETHVPEHCNTRRPCHDLPAHPTAPVPHSGGNRYRPENHSSGLYDFAPAALQCRPVTAAYEHGPVTLSGSIQADGHLDEGMCDDPCQCLEVSIPGGTSVMHPFLLRTIERKSTHADRGLDKRLKDPCAGTGTSSHLRPTRRSPHSALSPGFTIQNTDIRILQIPLVFRSVPAVLRWSTADTVALCAKAVVQTIRDSHGSHEPVPRNSSPDQAGSCQRCEFPQSAVRQAASTNPAYRRWTLENREFVCAGTVFAEAPERCRHRCEWGNCVVSFTDCARNNAEPC